MYLVNNWVVSMTKRLVVQIPLHPRLVIVSLGKTLNSKLLVKGLAALRMAAATH